MNILTTLWFTLVHRFTGHHPVPVRGVDPYVIECDMDDDRMIGFFCPPCGALFLLRHLEGK